MLKARFLAANFYCPRMKIQPQILQTEMAITQFHGLRDILTESWRLLIYTPMFVVNVYMGAEIMFFQCQGYDRHHLELRRTQVTRCLLFDHSRHFKRKRLLSASLIVPSLCRQIALRVLCPFDFQDVCSGLLLFAPKLHLESKLTSFLLNLKTNSPRCKPDLLTFQTKLLFLFQWPQRAQSFREKRGVFVYLHFIYISEFFSRKL